MSTIIIITPLLLFKILVFTTMNDEITGAVNQLGIFGRTIGQIKNDISGKNFSSLFNIIPKSEVAVLQNYGQALLNNTNKIKTLNQWLANGQITQQQYTQNFEKHIGTLKNCSTTTQLLGKRMESLHNDFMAGRIDAATYTQTINAMTAAQKAAAVASGILSTALKVVFNMALVAVISAIVTGISSFVDYLGKTSERATEAAKATDEQIKSLDELKEKYLEIIDSDKTEIQKTKELNEWKDTLIKTYGLEKSILEEVNSERQTGIGLIEEESRKARELWLGKQESAINDAKRAIETDNYSNVEVKNVAKTYEFVNGIRKEILDLFDETKQEADGLTSLLSGFGLAEASDIAIFSFDTDNLYETKKRLEAVITEMGSYSYDLLSFEEKTLLNNLNNYLNQVDSVIEKHGTVYDTYQKYTAQNAADTLYTDYIKQQGKAISLVTEETFDEWKKGLLELAGESEPTKKALEELINNLFPQYVEAVENKIGGASISTAQKLEELNTSLDSVYESFDTAFSNQSTIQSAFDKIQAGTSLTAAEMRSLIKLCKKEFPEIGSLFTKTEKGYTISAENLIKANDAIMQSTKDTVNEQIKGYQEVINAYEHRTYDDKGFAENLGITEAEYQEAKQQIENLNQVLDAFGLIIDKDTDALEEYTKALKSISANLATGASAQKEMNESGKISASTLESLLSLGEDYIKCITIENGIIKFNAEEYKNLEKAKIDDKIATIKLTEAEIIYNRNQAAMYGNSSRVSELNALLADEQAKRQALEALKDSYDVDWDEALKDKSSKSEDTVKKNFESFMQEYEKLHDRGLMSDEDYYNKLEEANEQFYKNCEDHLDDYISNETKIYNARKDKYKSDTKEMVDNLKDQYDAGKIALEDYAKVLSDLSSSRYGEGSTYFGTEFATDALKENFKDAFDTITDAAKNSLSKMLITPDKYLDLINKWGKKLEITDGVLEKAKEVLSESDYLDAWDLANGYDSKNNKDYELRAKRVAYIYELAEKLYGKDGQNNVKAYNELVKKGLEEEKSIWEDRVNDEKSFWEDRKEEIESHYDTEIDKLKEVQDEENKLKDIEEKRLALIKARQNLENAKNQRNQLIFEGGTFRYDVDQDAILSAEEELADAIEALRDEELNTQIELLEEQKNNAVEFYKNIIDKIDEYLNKEDKILNSDSDVLNTILESDAPKANFDIQKFIDGGSNFESLVRALGGTFTQKAADYFKDSYNATLVGKQITPSTIDKVVNNSNSTTNNNSKSVVIEKMEINVELTVESLEDFVDNKIEGFGKKIIEGMNRQLPSVLAKA